MDKNNNISFIEDDIRPDKYKLEQEKCLNEDIQELIKHKKNFINVACPSCESTNSKLAFTKHELEYLLCSECKTIYISPRPTKDILESYYKNSKNYAFWNNFIFPKTSETRRNKIFKPRAIEVEKIALKYCKDNNLLVEIGAGFGLFCEEIAKRDIFKKIIAIEPTPSLAESCRQKKIEVIESFIENIKLPPNSVDVIVSFEVIEHILHPDEFMRHCYRLLKPKGILILTCPNGNGFEILTLKEASTSVDNEHLNYFNPESIRILSERTGFFPLEVTTPGQLDSELVRKAHLSGAIDLSDYPFLKTILVDKWDLYGHSFQKFLVENTLSSHMWLVAQKKK